MKCPGCLNDNFTYIKDKHVEITYKMVHCLSCDLVFSDPMVGGSADWYETNENGLAFKFITDKQPHMGWYHEAFFEEHLQAKKILDIGCGRGDFIKVAENKGYLVTGIDFDKTNVKIARENFKLKNVYAATLDEFATQNSSERFDAITFFEVLEHLPDPRLFISNIKKLLTPEGYIALSVPNRKRFINTIAYLDKPPYHLTRWTESALKNLLLQTGFIPIRFYIPPIKSDDLTDIIRFGLGQKMMKAGRESVNQDLVKAANIMHMFKRIIFKIFTVLIAQILRAANCPGNGLYCLAQFKGNKREIE